MSFSPPKKGFTIAETLIGLMLMAAIFIPFYMTMGKSKAQVIRQGFYRKLNFEANQLLDNLVTDIKSSHTVDDTSFSRLLSVERFKNGLFMGSRWRISPVGSINQLDFATRNFSGGSWGGWSSWLSPFANSDSTTYGIGSGDILYCGLQNNCTVFTDTNSNGQYDVGTDATGTLAAGYTGTALTRPSQARKIVLRNWVFTRANTSSPVSFAVPDTVIPLPEPAYSTTNRPLVTIQTNAAGSNFTPIETNLADVEFHAPSRQLFAVGGWSGGTSLNIIRTNPEGVLIGPVITVSGTPVTASSRLISIAPMTDANKAWILDTGVQRVYQVSLVTGIVEVGTTYNYTAIGGFMPTAVLFDESVPDSFYLVGLNSGPRAYRITRNSSTGVYASDTTYTLPATLTAPAGATLDPISGDLLVANQAVSGNKLWLYRIKLSDPTTENRFQLDMAGLGGTTTAGSYYFGLGMDAIKNRLFISDYQSRRIFYALPDRSLMRLQ